MSSAVEILLVDDEARNLDALEVILDSPDYRLLRATDADTALRLLLSHDVAVIVLDIKMPGMTGFELARMIKGTKRFRGTPIVFLTAYLLDDQNIVAGYGAGGVDYLTKPVNPEILRQKIAVFADLHRQSRELAELNAELARLNEKLEDRVRERTSELEKSEAMLRASAEQKDQFLAILAHELRNPLAPLRTGLDLLLRRYSTTAAPQVERTLGAMDRQLDHMVRLIDDLLDVSRLNRGLLELKRERVDLGELVRETVESVRHWFDRRRQPLAVELADNVVTLADSTRIAQIVTNLLHNATKFTPEGGSVGIYLETKDENAHIRVVDAGAGVRNAELERVFDMFAQVRRDGVATEAGLGIGLALARRLAEMHGGSLTLSSEGEGRGSTITLCIPLLDSQHASVPGEPLERPPEDGALSLAIVVVEDNEDVAEVMAEWLRELGHRVTVARTGESGLGAIREVMPDLVICDLGLPGLGGLDVCRRVRESENKKQPTMIALTGWGRADDLRVSKEAGFDFHLVKPVAPASLQELIAKISERSRA